MMHKKPIAARLKKLKIRLHLHELTKKLQLLPKFVGLQKRPPEGSRNKK